MNREIFCVLGSSNKNGYTQLLLDKFLSKFSYECSITVFNPFQNPVVACNGCGYCKKNTNCIHNDFTTISDSFLKSDIVVIATPVYNLSFPAPLKAVIDRTQVYYNSRFIKNVRPNIPKAKKAVLISCCGSSDTLGFDIIKKQLNMTFSILNTTLLCEVLLPSTDSKPNISKAFSQIDIVYRKLLNL